MTPLLWPLRCVASRSAASRPPTERARLPDGVRMPDGNLRTWEKPSLLVGASVDSEIKKIRGDAAVIEQRVALARRAIADDAAASALGVDEKLQQIPLHHLHATRKR